MQYLLDTHTFLWFINGSNELSHRARSIIENSETDCYVSIASFWELAIKLNLGKLVLKMPFLDLYEELENNGFDLLPITIAHTEYLTNLDLHHRDPFDRLIISQAIIDNLSLISRDSNFKKYGVNLIW